MRKIPLFLFITSLTLITSLGFALSKPPAGIILYEQPDTKSTIVESISPGQAIIPIFSNNNWTKVGDPKTGNVGWISNDVLHANGMIYTKTTVQPIPTPATKGYQVVQYSGTQQLDEKQIEQLMQNWQKTQQNFNRTFNQMINQSVSNLNQLLQQYNQQQSHELQSPNTPDATPQPQGSVIFPASGQSITPKP